MATFTCTIWFLCVIFFTYNGTHRVWNHLTADKNTTWNQKRDNDFKTSLLITGLFMVSSLVVGVFLIPLLISLFF
jgi:ABC-type sugar transport system permease subunit